VVVVVDPDWLHALSAIAVPQRRSRRLRMEMTVPPVALPALHGKLSAGWQLSGG
jgi:hypothetical protein